MTAPRSRDIDGQGSAEAILDDAVGHLSVSFQDAVRAIATIVAPKRAHELGDLADTSPNEARRRLDNLLTPYPVGAVEQESVLRVAWAYGERRFIRSLCKKASPGARERAERQARIEARKQRRARQRGAGARLLPILRLVAFQVRDFEFAVTRARTPCT